MILLLIYFIILLGLSFFNKSIAIFFIALHLISLIGTLFIGVDISINSFNTFLNLLFTNLILSLIILPWRFVRGIKEIQFNDEKKLLKFTYFIIIISVIPFILFSIVTYFVFTLVENIDEFKYIEDVSTNFYYNLPINIYLLMLSSFLYYFSYLLLPLHFYYLGKGKYLVSTLCFIFSINIILYGLTFFSRSVVIQYVLLYLSFLILLYKTFSNKIRRVINFSGIILGTVLSSYFIYITNERFTNDKSYTEFVPKNALIQDPVLFSYFDYMSQWYGHSLTVLSNYNYKTFSGQISMQSLLSLLGQYGLINYKTENYIKLRQELWPLNWYTFNGFVAYSVYDYGYILTFILCILYYFTVSRLKPNMIGSIKLFNLFFIVMLIQIPLTSIFYSSVGGIIIPSFILIPSFLYLRTTWR